ncbi:AEC family transporter [Gorillibacterium timonense]|uniref:AEC family transporter n=1 Tax=Gorillibacterium timonense TaxID=1689269 RepID=UPI00071C4160|nr:AEC family transporter [Gorillibacterium timonense]
MTIADTLLQVIIPILIPLGIGAVLHRKFQFALGSFSKLIMYYYLPALAFVKVYEASLTASLVVTIVGFLALQFVVVLLLSQGISRLLGFPRSLAGSFANSTLLTNNGNIGIPVNAMAFKHDPFALSIQVMVVTFELFTTFTFGLFNVSRAASGWRNSLLQFGKMPVIYALILGALLRLAHIQVPTTLLSPLSTIADGMLSFALLSIGAQLVSTPLKQNTSAVLMSSFVRLAAAPACAGILLHLLHVHGITAQALLIASAIPTSRNSAALALEYDNEPGFAAQAVLVSTLLSSISLTIVIQLAQALFPV